MSFRQGARDTGAAFWAWFVGITLIILTVLALLATWAGVAPWAANKEREIKQNTQQYADTHVRAMRDQINQYNQNAKDLAALKQDPQGNAELIRTIEDQQAGIVNDVRGLANELNPAALPSDVLEFLSQRG